MLSLQTSQVEINDILSKQMKEDGKLAICIGIVLAGNHAVDSGRVSIDVVDSVVTMSGWANTIAEKVFLEQEVWTVPGIKQLVNEIQICRSTPASDVGITSEILQCFSLCLKLDLSAIFVMVCNGIVFLRGAVPTSHSRTKAGTLAGKIPQVIGVINELQVVPRQAREIKIAAMS